MLPHHHTLHEWHPTLDSTFSLHGQLRLVQRGLLPQECVDSDDGLVLRSFGLWTGVVRIVVADEVLAEALDSIVV